jgi:serine O-acetyltransferase
MVQPSVEDNKIAAALVPPPPPPMGGDFDPIPRPAPPADPGADPGTAPEPGAAAKSPWEAARETDHLLGAFNLNPPGISLWQLWKEDLRTHDGDLFEQGFWAMAVHRFGNWRMDLRPKLLRAPFSLLYKVAYKVVEWTCGISLPYTVKVGRRVRIWHHSGMILGALSIGDDVHLRQNTTLGVARRGAPRWEKPIIEDRCDLGSGVVIVGPITVGHDTQVGANAVVIKDVPPHSVAVGIPAKVVKSSEPNE